MSSTTDTAFGGEFIPLCAPEIGGNSWKYIKECLDTGWVSSAGTFVDRFEDEVAAYVSSQYGVAMSSGTAALHVALRVVGVEPNDEVIVSNLSFVAAANAVQYCGGHPILMDVSEETWQIDVDKVAQFLEKECLMKDSGCFNRATGRRVRAILPVHILGMACDMSRILELANRYDLRVVEDAAEGLGVLFSGRQIGTFGDVGVLSFNGNKIVTAGGGGMLLTDNEEYARRARYLTTQAKDDPIEYLHKEVGYNYRLSNLQAALGVAQLEEIERFVGIKRSIARFYEENLGQLPGIRTMPRVANSEPTFWLYTVLLDPETTLASRRRFVDNLRSDGIGVRSLWYPINDLPPFQKCQSYQITSSSDLFRRAVSLPSGVGIQKTSLERCTESFVRHL